MKYEFFTSKTLDRHRLYTVIFVTNAVIDLDCITLKMRTVQGCHISCNVRANSSSFIDYHANCIKGIINSLLPIPVNLLICNDSVNDGYVKKLIFFPSRKKGAQDFILHVEAYMKRCIDSVRPFSVLAVFYHGQKHNFVVLRLVLAKE